MTGRKQSWKGFRRYMGIRLRELRMARGLSQEELAWEVNVAQGSISNYEIGRNDIPLSVLIAICHALHVSPAQLLPSCYGTGTASSNEARACPACREALRIA